MIDYGIIAWEAYAKAVGGKTFDGKPLPEWKSLGPLQQDGWRAAAEAAIKAYQ